MNSRLFIVIPCYNEEEVLPFTSKMFLEELEDLIHKGKISDNSRILFVNDGSKDQTWNLISKFNEQEKWVSGLNLAGNVGHQNALYAGLMTAYKNVDATISIDADLQDDINVIENMIDEFPVTVIPDVIRPAVVGGLALVFPVRCIDVAVIFKQIFARNGGIQGLIRKFLGKDR